MQKYTAAILNDDGSELAPLNIEGAHDDKQAEAIARREAQKWMARHRATQATVRIRHLDYLLDIQLDIEVSR